MVSFVSSYIFILSTISSSSGSDDLYAVLGVKTTATTKEIKSAYRRKALDTHPDKNKNVSPEEAAAAFHQVVHAFEILSDVESRRRYDNGDGTTSTSSGRQQQNSWSFQQWFFQQGNRRSRTQQLKNRFEVKQAQSRVLHVVSLEQLRTIMLDDFDRLERHLLICFFTPKIETIVDDEILYPYPFAGKNPHQVWWEDLLQTVSIRFNRSNALTRYFNIQGVGADMTEPTFLFLKRGTELGDSFEYDPNQVYSCKIHNAFESWMWTMIEVKVSFLNKHSHPVEIYWISGNNAQLKHTIEPNEVWEHYSMLTHNWWTRDATVDKWDGSPGRWKLTDSTSLGSWKIGVETDDESSSPILEDGSVFIQIPNKTCIDFSGHCQFWARQNQCSENPSFMRDKCSLTCNHCGGKGHNDEL